MINFTDMSDEMIYCSRHPDKEAVGACLGCGKPLCDICGEWFKGRFYCPGCYANVEIMHAQAESVDVREVQWYHAPQYLIVLLFGAFCLFIAGFGFMSIYRINLGLGLWFLSWLFLAFALAMVRGIQILSKKIKKMITILIWLGLFLLPILSMFLLFNRSFIR